MTVVKSENKPKIFLKIWNKSSLFLKLYGTFATNSQSFYVARKILDKIMIGRDFYKLWA